MVIAQQDQASPYVMIPILLGLGGLGLIQLFKDRPRTWHVIIQCGIVLGVLSGVGFFIFCLLNFKQFEKQGVDGLIFWGGIVALFAGLVWFFLAALAAFLFHFVFVPLRSGWHWLARRDDQTQPARAYQRSVEDDRRRRDQDEAATAQKMEQQRIEKEQTRFAKKRREDARASCELLYSLYAPEIGKRFPEKSFQDFLAKYMGDAQSPEDVEDRGKQLQAILEQHFRKVSEPETFGAVEEVAHWFLEQKKRIESLPLEESFKKDHLFALNERYLELTEKVIARFKS